MECTGVLAHGEADGVIHGRNMDIGLQVENVTAQMQWKKKGKVVFTSTQVRFHWRNFRRLFGSHAFRSLLCPSLTHFW